MNRAAPRVEGHKYNALQLVINKDWMENNRTNGNRYMSKQLRSETARLELQLKLITFAEFEKKLDLDHFTNPSAQLSRFLYPCLLAKCCSLRPSLCYHLRQICYPYQSYAGPQTLT
jgi:hypothetical protein